MSGSTGADRIKSRADFDAFVASYKPLIAKFPGFVDVRPSGSYNSNPDKQDFGDIDLITHIKSDDKVKTKKELVAFFVAHPETTIVPFSSVKHAGKRTYNSGEIVTVRYHDDQLGYSVQVDNIIASSEEEATFKQRFLDMPAEEQGLILGLVKIATIETAPAVLFQKLRIDAPTQLEANQEYEFNLSGVELQLRKVTYEPGTFKQLSRDIIWNSKNFDNVATLLYQYDLKAGFENLLQQTKQNIRNPRSNARMQGVFSSMISVKSGEVGTAKGAGKETALAKVQQAFGESHNKTLFRSLMENNNRKIVFAFGRFQPPTIGHELLINRVKQTAEHVGAAHAIYVSKTQDHKTNPLAVDQKIAYLRKMFPGTTFVAADATVRTPIEAAKHLNQTYNELIMVAGSDRASSFENLLNTYNGKDFNYQSIQVGSSGERDPDSDEAAGMSGTKMREAAVANDFQTFRQGLPSSLSDDDAMKLMNLVRTGLTKPEKVKVKEEAGAQLSVEQLATISDEALDNTYHYGRSSPGNTFGWQANLKSAAYAKQMIDKGVTDIEAISDAIHKGWNVTAQAFVQNPDQFDDTEKLKAAGKLEAKLQQRAQLMKQNYAQLPDDEKEKDRVVARALLQAIRGTHGLAEFAPGSGGGESGRWYTDDQITDLVGDEWWNDLDVSGDISKQQMIQQAQAWLDDQGYSVQVLNCKVNDDDMEWFIEGNFHNPRFAKEGVAEGSSNAMATTASRLSNKDDGKVAKLRAAGDKRREDQLKGRDIAKRDTTSKDDWGNLKEAVDPESDVYLESVIAELSNSVVEVLDDPWGPQGNFAGDKPVNVGGVSMKRIEIGDTVKYLGQKAEVLSMSTDRKHARVTISKGMGEVTQTVLTSDLKQLGQGFAEERMSAAVRLARAADRQRAKSSASRKRGEEVMSQARSDWEKKQAAEKNKEQGVAEGSQEINWVKPNFDFEWHEVEEQSRMKQVPVDVRQYYQKHFPNKDAWLKAVQNGKAVVVPPDHAYEIRNAPFDKASLQKVLAPTGHEGPIGPAKEKRVNDLFDKGQVEMPIILKTSQGLWLIGGKTRLGTANYVKGLPAKVWLISGEQGVAEEKQKGVDGKACWNNYRYNGTENGKDKCVKVSEDIENIMESFINKIIVNEAIQNNKR
jgi:hypothetical protein